MAIRHPSPLRPGDRIGATTGDGATDIARDLALVNGARAEVDVQAGDGSRPTIVQSLV